jgi:hypothetical protein
VEEKIIKQFGNNTNERIIELLLRLESDASRLFKPFFGEFAKSHGEYTRWLGGVFSEYVKIARRRIDLFNILGLDWITIHYDTRHSADFGSEPETWIAKGIPLASYMVKYESILQVNPGQKPPYVAIFTETQKNIRPVIVILGYDVDEQTKMKGTFNVRG